MSCATGHCGITKPPFQPPTGPLTQMQPRTALLPLRPSLGVCFTEEAATITHFSTTKKWRSELCRQPHFVKFAGIWRCQSVPAALELLGRACYCCSQTAAALFWTYAVTSAEIPSRLFARAASPVGDAKPLRHFI